MNKSESLLTEIYNSTLRPDSEFGGEDSDEHNHVSGTLDALLEGARIHKDLLEAIQETVVDLEGIKHKEGFMSGFKYAMRIFSECAKNE